MIRIEKDKLARIAEIFERKYPEVGDVNVTFATENETGASGYTERIGEEWRIVLNKEILFCNVCNNLIEELAHVVDATRNAEHGISEFTEAWEEIMGELEKEIEEETE